MVTVPVAVDHIIDQSTRDPFGCVPQILCGILVHESIENNSVVPQVDDSRIADCPTPVIGDRGVDAGNQLVESEVPRGAIFHSYPFENSELVRYLATDYLTVTLLFCPQ
jgi:hypothetical protein